MSDKNKNIILVLINLIKCFLRINLFRIYWVFSSSEVINLATEEDILPKLAYDVLWQPQDSAFDGAANVEVEVIEEVIGEVPGVGVDDVH